MKHRHRFKPRADLTDVFRAIYPTDAETLQAENMIVSVCSCLRVQVAFELSPEILVRSGIAAIKDGANGR